MGFKQIFIQGKVYGRPLIFPKEKMELTSYVLDCQTEFANVLR